jgi:outer membrane biosynthesis protein TonB
VRWLSMVALFAFACSPVTPTPFAGPERQQALDQYTELFAQRIAERWNPRQALRDYPNQVLGSGSYTTVVWVIVDALGDVVVADVAKSAKDYLDREALRAIGAAGPFTAPPEGLLYRSSRGLVAGFPLQFTVNLPGAPGSYVQNRQNQEGKITLAKPLELVAEL